MTKEEVELRDYNLAAMRAIIQQKPDDRLERFTLAAMQVATVQNDGDDFDPESIPF